MIKYINLFKKTGLILLILLYLLLIISTYLSSYYLDFFLDNLEKICEYYLNTKKIKFNKSHLKKRKIIQIEGKIKFKS